MSMAKKIFGIVILLVVICIAILVVGIYSVDTLGGSLTTLSGVAKRNVNYATMSDLQLRRRINLLLVLRATTDEEIKGPSNRLDEINTRFMEELDALRNNLPPNPAVFLKQGVEDLERTWKKYVEVTVEVRQLGMENSNNRARVIYNNSSEFWQSIDKRLENLAVVLQSNDKPEIFKHGSTMRGLRADLAFFQAAIGRYVNAINAANAASIIMYDMFAKAYFKK